QGRNEGARCGAGACTCTRAAQCSGLSKCETRPGATHRHAAGPAPGRSQARVVDDQASRGSPPCTVGAQFTRTPRAIIIMDQDGYADRNPMLITALTSATSTPTVRAHTM